MSEVFGQGPKYLVKEKMAQIINLAFQATHSQVYNVHIIPTACVHAYTQL